jgi:hypothetical protein
MSPKRTSAANAFLFVFFLFIMVACASSLTPAPTSAPTPGDATGTPVPDRLSAPATAATPTKPSPATVITVDWVGKTFRETAEHYWGGTIDFTVNVGMIVEPPEEANSCGPQANLPCVPEWYANGQAITHHDGLVSGGWSLTRPLVKGSRIRLGTACEMLAHARTAGYADPVYTDGKFVRIVGYFTKSTAVVSVQGWNWLPGTILTPADGKLTTDRERNLLPFADLTKTLGCQ